MIALYPGSFDPITLGHVDIAARASRLFERIIIAVVKNGNKTPLFDVTERLTLVEAAVSHLPNVQVESFEGLTVAFAKKNDAKVLIRGLRAVSDFEYEFMMAKMNRSLYPEIETILMMASHEHQFLSSSVVKEVSSLGGDVSFAVPAAVHKALKRKFHRSNDDESSFTPNARSGGQKG